ncbi:MAG: hypothetical protein H6P99_1304 [Holophagaceae bacterium]|nr:hypothetical protein [Holophagaceae bacterium]
MLDQTALLQHFLAALAYRTQKALRNAHGAFPGFQAGAQVRTPHDLVCHMNSVLGYACTFFTGGVYDPGLLPDFQEEVARYHDTLARLARLIQEERDWRDISPERLLQGPLSDAMTHAGQLSLLRRLSGDPVPPENFVFARIDPANLGADQPAPAAPDAVWPEAPGREA